MPFMSLVRSLNWVTNWPMLTPCWPRAGPTGGAGVAAPPVTWSLMSATFCFAFAMVLPLDDFHLPVIQLHRDRAAEDGQLHLDLVLGLHQLLDLALHAGEHAVLDPHPVALVELRLDLLDARLELALLAEHALDLLGRHRRRRPVDAAADEVAHARRLAEQVQDADRKSTRLNSSHLGI